MCNLWCQINMCQLFNIKTHNYYKPWFKLIHYILNGAVVCDVDWPLRVVHGFCWSFVVHYVKNSSSGRHCEWLQRHTWTIISNCRQSFALSRELEQQDTLYRLCWEHVVLSACEVNITLCPLYSCVLVSVQVLHVIKDCTLLWLDTTALSVAFSALSTVYTWHHSIAVKHLLSQCKFSKRLWRIVLSRSVFRNEDTWL